MPGLAERIRKLLEDRGEKPSPFAARHGLTQLTRYLSSGAIPSFESLTKLADKLDIDWRLLLIGEEGLRILVARYGLGYGLPPLTLKAAADSLRQDHSAFLKWARDRLKPTAEELGSWLNDGPVPEQIIRLWLTDQNAEMQRQHAKLDKTRASAERRVAEEQKRVRRPGRERRKAAG